MRRRQGLALRAGFAAWRGREYGQRHRPTGAWPVDTTSGPGAPPTVTDMSDVPLLELTEQDYLQMEEALSQTARGRAFLRMRDRRSRAIATDDLNRVTHALEQQVNRLRGVEPGAIARLPSAVGLSGGLADGLALQQELTAITQVVRETRSDIAALRPADTGSNRIEAATGELDEIVAAKRLDLAMEERAVPLPALIRQAHAAPPVRGFAAALAKPGLSVIAEVKRASPSKGMIAQDFDPAAIARQYGAGGASALSVLTERHWFLGCNRYLTQARAEVSVPVLRKDFIISPRQVVGARAIGADAILLIAAILDDRTMAELFAAAREYGLDCLFEAHTEAEVKRAADCGAQLIGINNRNLKTMEVDLSAFEALRRHIPQGVLAVAESGIHSAGDARQMREAGADAVLVGESLMRSGDPAAALRELAAIP